LSAWLTKLLGWHGALRTLGIRIIAIALPMAYFIKEAPEREAERKAAAPPASMAGVFRSPWFYLLAIGSMCSIGAVGGTTQHLKLFLSRDYHYTQFAAAKIISLYAMVSIVGRLLMGWLADRIAKKYVMLLIYLLIAGAIPALFFAETPGALYVFAIIFGLGLGGEYLIIPLIAGELFGVRVLGRLLGVVLTVDGVAEALSPLGVGYLRDRTQSYHAGFGVLIVMALVGAAAVALLPKTRPLSAPALEPELQTQTG
jgi:nitrate/nitrite transporter NarK